MSLVGNYPSWRARLSLADPAARAGHPPVQNTGFSCAHPCAHPHIGPSSLPFLNTHVHQWVRGTCFISNIFSGTGVWWCVAVTFWCSFEGTPGLPGQSVTMMSQATKRVGALSLLSLLSQLHIPLSGKTDPALEVCACYDACCWAEHVTATGVYHTHTHSGIQPPRWLAPYWQSPCARAPAGADTALLQRVPFVRWFFLGCFRTRACTAHAHVVALAGAHIHTAAARGLGNVNVVPMHGSGSRGHSHSEAPSFLSTRPASERATHTPQPVTRTQTIRDTATAGSYHTFRAAVNQGALHHQFSMEVRCAPQWVELL